MFVVRLTVESEMNDFKAYVKKTDAEKRFIGGWYGIEDYEKSSAALYQVEGTDDAREAVEAVQNKRSGLILLDSRPLPNPFKDIEINL